MAASAKVASAPASPPRPSGAVPPDLARLLDHALPAPRAAAVDGRRTGVVIAKVQDRAGATRAGILVRLLVNGTLLDQCRTDARGTALLRFPERLPVGKDALCALEVVLPGRGGPDGKAARQMLFTLGEQGTSHAVVDVALDALPVGDLPPGDDPLRRLPLDFTPALFDDLVRLVGPPEDPVLGSVGAGSFASRRAPLVKRVTLARLGVPPAPGEPPRRYLVRLRQEWVFLGYGLGEVAGMENLAPGHVAERSRQSLERTLERQSESVGRAVSEAHSTGERNASQAQRASSQASQSFASSASASTSASTSATSESGGFALSLGVLSAGYAKSSANATARTEAMSALSSQALSQSSSDVAMQANEMMRAAQSAVNETVSRARDTARHLESSAQDTVRQVSPLLARMTNLVRWTLFETYAVCSRVESVTEVRSCPTFEAPADGVLFPAEDIVEYEPHFLPRLLDPRLAARFAGLRQKVEEARGGATPVAAIRLTVDYDAPRATGRLDVALGAQSVRVPLPRGGARAEAWLRLDTPLARPELEGDRLVVRLAAHDAPPVADPAREAGLLHVGVSAITLDYVTLAGTRLRSVQRFGAELQVVGPQRATPEHAFAPSVPGAQVHPELDPLFLHVNRNRNHYMGVLLEAALDNPALRDDLPQMAGFRGTHWLWRMPLLGFEGSRMVVLADPLEDDAFAKDLLASPGAATLVQVAAPGTYGEALQGVLELADLRGRVPPQLLSVQALPPGYTLHDPGAEAPGEGSGAGEPLPGPDDRLGVPSQWNSPPLPRR